jgi:biotin carboxylase
MPSTQVKDIDEVKGTDEVKGIDQAKAIANSLGYPVLLKASAGGGG